MNDRITLTEIFEAFAGYGPAVWLGVLAAIVTFIIEVILCTKGILFAGGEQKLKRAKKEGKFVLGTLKNSWYKEREPEEKTANRLYTGIYEYTVDGLPEQSRLFFPAVSRPTRSVSTTHLLPNMYFPSMM